jgi:tripartite-type tricarboxylate transporter receptor subunit TctC
MINHRQILRRDFLVIGAAACVMPSGSWAQDYPVKPIRMFVAHAAGGGVDLSARLVSDVLTADLKAPVVIENKAGASGMLCADYVAKARPDGYSLMICGGSAVTIAPHFVGQPSFNAMTDLTPVNTIGASPLAISLNPGLGIRTLREFMEAARTRSVTLGSAGGGSLTHLVIEKLSQATGGRILHVPYKGGGPGVIDALGGHVDGMVTDLPPVQQHFRSGALIPISITSERRSDLLSDVPTLSEAIPGFAATSWLGYFAPAKTPQLIVDKISAALMRAVARDEIANQLKKTGIEPYSYPTPGEFGTFFRDEYNRWGAFIRESGIKAE